MIYVVRSKSSLGAKELVTALNALKPGSARRIRKTMPMIRSTDVLVGWGDNLSPIAGCKVINGGAKRNKYSELVALATAGVSVPPHSRTRQTGWLARVDNHTGAKDLLAGRTTGDFYVQYVPCDREYRVHSFDGDSIRLAKKVPNTEGKPVNQRFRAYDGGWRFSYAKHLDVPRGLRDVAHSACKALGYTFGAVDIGVTKDGKLIVFEVNSAPGLEGGTGPKYATAILRHLGAL